MTPRAAIAPSQKHPAVVKCHQPVKRIPDRHLRRIPEGQTHGFEPFLMKEASAPECRS